MATNIWMIGHQVELQEMLAGREKRALTQQDLMTRYPGTLVCFTLNIAGPIKVFPLAEEVFDQVEDKIKTCLWNSQFKIKKQMDMRHPYGWEVYFAVEGQAEDVKRVLLTLEENEPAGRLFDIDVLRADGSKVSRADMGLEPRSCIVCGKETSACARSRAHTVEELQKVTAELLLRQLAGTRMTSYMIGRLCRQAMLMEVYTTPKPGLVDRNNTGAHRDMDLQLFEKSTEVLEPFFVEFAMTGRELYEEKPEEILRCIRPIGIRAEAAMFEATMGVNTHKGMIFSLGILATATGWCIARAGRHPVTLDEILRAAGVIALPAWRYDFDEVKLAQPHIPTAGEREFRKYGIGGIRKEAADGFPSVVRFSWPIISAALGRDIDYNQAGSMALLNLIANVTDTNVIKRSSVEEQEMIQEEVREILNDPAGVRKSRVLELDEKFIRMNVSPGGCADLLALTYYIYMLAVLM